MDYILSKDLLVSESLKVQYSESNPFPSIVLDNFFNPEYLNSVLNEFPNLDSLESTKFNGKLEKKLQGKGEKHFGPKTKQLMHFMNSEPVLNFLQDLTGIEETLVGDPYFNGGGQHEIKKGGLLKVHADFNKHPELKLDRRINLLIYLNKDWKEDYGGHFELWNKEMTKAEQRILPLFNRVTIFSTTDFSYHGHPDPLNCPDGMSRKSLALYYYSNGRPLSEVDLTQKEHNTLFKARKGSLDDNKAFEKPPKPSLLRRAKKKLFG